MSLILQQYKYISQLEVSWVSSHTEKLWYHGTVYLWMTINTLPSRVLSTLAKELTAATRVMQSSSNEFRSNNAKCKQTKADTYAL